MTTAKFKITEDDYIAAIRLHSRKPRVLLGAWLVLALIIAAGGVYGSEESRTTAFIAFACNLLVFLALPVLRLVSRRHYRNYRAIHGEFSATLRESGLHLATEFGESLVTWSNILKWRHNDHFLLLYIAPSLFHVVPKTIATQGFDLGRLLEILDANVGPAR